MARIPVRAAAVALVVVLVFSGCVRRPDPQSASDDSVSVNGSAVQAPRGPEDPCVAGGGLESFELFRGQQSRAAWSGSGYSDKVFLGPNDVEFPVGECAQGFEVIGRWAEPGGQEWTLEVSQCTTSPAAATGVSPLALLVPREGLSGNETCLVEYVLPSDAGINAGTALQWNAKVGFRDGKPRAVPIGQLNYTVTPLQKAKGTFELRPGQTEAFWLAPEPTAGVIANLRLAGPGDCKEDEIINGYLVATPAGGGGLAGVQRDMVSCGKVESPATFEISIDEGFATGELLIFGR